MTGATTTDTNAVVEYMRTRDRLTAQKKGATVFFTICFLIPPFQLLLPVAMWMLLKRDRALKKHERGKA